MKIQNYVVSIILAAGLTSSSAVLLGDLTFQSAFAQMVPLANPSGSNVTGGNVTSENMTGAEEGIPTANTTGEEVTHTGAMP
jgi:hypothetical protein